MKVDMDSNDAFRSIAQEIARIPGLTAEREKKAMKGIGNTIASAVKAELPVSDGSGTNYDGSRPYLHMRSDVKVSTKSSDGFCSVTIKGGKKTGYKWHLLDDGTRGPDGRVKTRAHHFISKAIKKSEADVEQIIDNLVSEVANGN